MSESADLDFAEFYEEWFDRVYNYARHRTGSSVRADEIVADVFTRALRSWDKFDAAKGDRKTWLFGIAFRAVADHFRSETRRAWSPLDLISNMKEKEPEPPQQLETNQAQDRLTAIIEELGDLPKQIVSLKFFGGLTNRAIAGLLGLTESNVAVILFRSVRKMKAQFSNVEADHG